MLDDLSVLWTTGEDRLEGDPPQAGSLKCDSELVSDAAEVRNRLVAFGGSGWACAPSEVVRVPDSPVPPVVLSAEVALGSTSLHVRQAGSGWRITRIERLDAGDAWIVQEQFAAAPRGTARYEVAWGPDADGVRRPLAARFVGFEGDGS